VTPFNTAYYWTPVIYTCQMTFESVKRFKYGTLAEERQTDNRRQTTLQKNA